MEQKPQLIFTFEQDDTEPAVQLNNITTYEQETDPVGDRVIKVRLDKWLWAARFFKTRPLARSAIEQGKILYDGQKAIPTKEIQLGATLIINQGRNKKVVVIKGLSTRRRNLDEADALYEELEGIYTHTALPVPPHFIQAQDEHQDFANKPRKAVRYLRRTMNIGDPSSISRELDQNDSTE